MKKFFLLSFATLIFLNTLFVADNSISTQSFLGQIKTEENMEKISPIGIWFTDDELP